MYEALLIYVGLGTLAYLYLKYKKKVGQELIIALLISIAWVSISGLYNYKNGNIFIFGINVFPVIMWTMSGVLLREIYERVTWKNKFFYITLFCIFIVTFIEYIGYNILDIQTVSTFKGLMGIEAMHMPWWGKLYYLVIGPIYLKITDYMNVR